MKTQQELDSERIAAAIEFLILHRTSHTGLGDVADHVHLSPATSSACSNDGWASPPNSSPAS